MEITIFEGELKMGDSKDTTMVFAQDFRVVQCAGAERKLTVECAGVEILGPEVSREISSHLVYLDHTLVGRLAGNRAEFTILPEIEAGAREYEALEGQGVRLLNDAGLATEYFHIRRASDLAAIRSGTRDVVLLAAACLGGKRLNDSRRVRLIERY